MIFAKTMTVESKNLACAIWFVDFCRKIRLPVKFQLLILEKSNGLYGIWQLDFPKLVNELKATIEAEDCDPYITGRTKIYFEKNHLNMVKQWQKTAERKSAIEQACLLNGKQIFALDYYDNKFPPKLKQISGCPAVLFFQGTKLDSFLTKYLAVTIVGTREATPYGLKVTENIAGRLALFDTVVISGLAKGIDARAHEAVLKNSGLTVGVVACGTDIFYPPQNKELQKKIADQGLLISEHPPGTKPIRQFFPARNRILSGLADIVIITESPKYSGTIVTAAFAADQGRDVFAVPGNILQKKSSGCHQLIKDGACLLDDIDEIINEYDCPLKKSELDDKTEDKSTADRHTANVSDIANDILSCLTERDMNINDISSQINQSIEKTASCLTMLELSGRILNSRGRYFLTYK